VTQLLTIVQAVNTVITLLDATGRSWRELNRAVNAAREAGREFGPADLERFAGDAHQAVLDLDAAIRAASTTSTEDPPP
jgi:hypothetical protein